MLNVDVSVDATRNLGPKAREGVMQYLEAGADRGFAEYIQQMPVDRSNMIDNSFSPTRDGDTVRYGTRNIPYAEAQDEGTPPFTPPIKPLLEWGERVAGDRGVGAAVWQKIRKEGIEPKHFSRAAREAQQDWYASHDAGPFVDRALR